jgi:hypothetical protein
LDVASDRDQARHGLPQSLRSETLKFRRTAILYPHRAAGCAVPTDDVTVSETLAGVRRQAAQQGQTPHKKGAATAGILHQILAHIPRGLRDRTILLIGFAGALRRSGLTSIRAEELEKIEHGLRLILHQTKGSQTEALIVLCPTAARLPKLTRPRKPPPLPQIDLPAISPWAVSEVVKTRAAAAGFGGRDFGGHSLKRDAPTTGMDLGQHPAKLKRLGRHKSFDVLGEYLEFGDPFEGHPLGGAL